MPPAICGFNVIFSPAICMSGFQYEKKLIKQQSHTQSTLITGERTNFSARNISLDYTSRVNESTRIYCSIFPRKLIPAIFIFDLHLIKMIKTQLFTRKGY